MNCKKCSFVVGLVLMLIAFMVFLIFSAFVVPVFAECSAASLTPQDPAIDLSLSDWLFGNMIAGLVIFFLLIAVSKQNGKDNDCGYAIFLTVASLYCVFEVIWSVIGFCIYGEYYKDACALQSQDFNAYVTAELVYSSILFPLIILLAIIAIIKICKEKTQSQPANATQINTGHQPLLNGQPIQPPQITPSNRDSNVYKKLYNRLSASFASRQNQNAIN